MANGKGHFGPTDRNDQTGHSGPPSKLVPNIPVRPNRNGPFHLMYQPKLPEFWVEWKAPNIIVSLHLSAPAAGEAKLKTVVTRSGFYKKESFIIITTIIIINL